MLSAHYASYSQVITWGLVLMGAIAALGIGLWLVRRSLFSTSKESAADEFWSLQHLREMRAGGQITEQEYERLRARMHKAAGRRNDASSKEKAHDRPAKP